MKLFKTASTYFVAIDLFKKRKIDNPYAEKN